MFKFTQYLLLRQLREVVNEHFQVMQQTIINFQTRCLKLLEIVKEIKFLKVKPIRMKMKITPKCIYIILQ